MGNVEVKVSSDDTTNNNGNSFWGRSGRNDRKQQQQQQQQQQQPQPEPVKTTVLVPPVIRQHGELQSRMAEDPVPLMIGAHQMSRLFDEFVADPNSVTADLGFATYTTGGEGNVQVIPQASVAHSKHTGGAHLEGLDSSMARSGSKVNLGVHMRSDWPGFTPNTGLFFRMQPTDSTHNFVDFLTTTEHEGYGRVRGSLYYKGFGVFGQVEGDKQSRGINSKLGWRVGVDNFSMGAVVQDALGPSDLSVASWLVGRYGNAIAGISSSTDVDLSDRPGSAKTGTEFDFRVAYTNLPTHQLLCDYDQRAISKPGLIMSLEALRNAKELRASFYERLAVTRPIYNPVDSSKVKDIVNYLDFGMQITHKIQEPGLPFVRMGASWQLNRAWMFKLGLSNFRDLELTTVFRPWWSPATTIGLTKRISGTHEPTVGLYLNLDNENMIEHVRPEETSAKMGKHLVMLKEIWPAEVKQQADLVMREHERQ